MAWSHCRADRQRLKLTLCDQIPNVEDGSSRAELLALETHGLLHTKDLGVVQRGLVQVLKGSGRRIRFSPAPALLPVKSDLLGHQEEG